MACFQCGSPLAAGSPGSRERCGDCLVDPPAYDHVLTPYLYSPPLDAVIHHLKFGSLQYLGDHAAAAISRRHGATLESLDVVVPVPLHWGRRLRRGYNQAEEISRPLARRLGRPHRRALRRIHRTRPQSELSREARRELSRDAFTVRRSGDIHRRHVLLVDDVVTTGTTAGAAAAALKKEGARSVTVSALARTPPPWGTEPRQPTPRRSR